MTKISTHVCEETSSGTILKLPIFIYATEEYEKLMTTAGLPADVYCLS